MDLNKLKEEIDSKKNKQNYNREALGEMVKPKQTGDQFLRELMRSAKTGQETDASIKVKAVDRLAEAKKPILNNKSIDNDILEHVPASNPKTNNGRTASIDAREDARRIQESYNKTNNQVTSSNKGFSEEISKYTNMNNVGAPMNNNGYLTEEQMIAKMNNGYQNGNGSQPSNVITEQVTNVARELLNENFGKLYAEAMKNSIIESYKAEIVKKAINENRGFIEQIVRETIIDLQKKAQSRS